jgi:hypothetical protein
MSSTLSGGAGLMNKVARYQHELKKSKSKKVNQLLRTGMVRRCTGSARAHLPAQGRMIGMGMDMQLVEGSKRCTRSKMATHASVPVNPVLGFPRSSRAR